MMTKIVCRSQFLILLASVNALIHEAYSVKIDQEHHYHQHHRPQQHHHHRRSHHHLHVHGTSYPQWDSGLSSTDSSSNTNKRLSDYLDDEKWPPLESINSRFFSSWDVRHINDPDKGKDSIGNDTDLYDSIYRMRRTLDSDLDFLLKSVTDSTTLPSISTTLSSELDPVGTASTEDYPFGHGGPENILDSIDYPSSSLSYQSSAEPVIAGGHENLTCTDEDDISCHNVTCVGDPIYCNLTYDEYMTLLYDYIYPTTPEWILIFSHTVVFIMGLVGNALVCIAVYTNYSMRTVTNIFIVNLAVADFFVILFCLPPTVVWDVTETWFMGNAMCKVVLYFQTVSVTVSVLTLTFISIDRWYAICFPLRYRTKISRAILSVAFIWVVALASDIPEFLVLTTIRKELRFGSTLFTQCAATWDNETEKNFYIIRFMMLYTLPLLLMTVAYFKIVRVLWKSETIPGHRESRNHQYTCGYLRGSCVPSANTSTMGQLRARRKAAKMLVAVVVMFAGCYFPVHVLNILRYTIDIGQSEIIAVLSLFSHWLCYANSAVNPVIYNFMSGKFRREFRNALEKCRCARVRVEDRSLNHSTPASRINNVSPSTRSNYQLTSVRDITRDMSRQTVQTTFIDNCGNGHSTTPMVNHINKTTERVP